MDRVSSIEGLPSEFRQRWEAKLAKDAEKVRPRSAHHEAGHAVAAVLLGQKLDYVDIIPKAFSAGGKFHGWMDSLGTTSFKDEHFSDFSGERGHANAEGRIVTVFAGSTAEYRFCGQNLPVRMDRESSDWRLIYHMATVAQFHAVVDTSKLLARMHANPEVRISINFASPYFRRRLASYFKPLRKQAAELIDNNWSAVERVADALIRKGKLNARQVKAIVRKG